MRCKRSKTIPPYLPSALLEDEKNPGGKGRRKKALPNKTRWELSLLPKNLLDILNTHYTYVPRRGSEAFWRDTAQLNRVLVADAKMRSKLPIVFAPPVGISPDQCNPVVALPIILSLGLARKMVDYMIVDRDRESQRVRSLFQDNLALFQTFIDATAKELRSPKPKVTKEGLRLLQITQFNCGKARDLLMVFKNLHIDRLRKCQYSPCPKPYYLVKSNAVKSNPAQGTYCCDKHRSYDHRDRKRPVHPAQSPPQ